MSVPKISSYKYSPLSAPRAFRLLHLLPGKGRQELRCELREANLDASPSFEALSYTWGDPKIRINIVCNSKRLDITESLSSALQVLRYADRTRILWADALCINQGDDGEKSAQVPFMCKIYRGAQRVVAWVGQEADDSMALEIGKYLHVPSGELSSSELSTWLALPVFIQRPWFSRVWIVQELAVAKSVTIQCGERQIEWENLRDGMETFLRRVGLFLNTSHGDVSLERIFALLGIRNLVTEHRMDAQSRCPQLGEYLIDHIGADRKIKDVEPGDMLTFVQATRLFGATDPRDRIYAMLGLALPSDVESIPVNYKHSKEDVYRNFTQVMMQHSGSLDVLSQAGISRNLPSWIADWSTPLNSHTLKLEAYNASRGSMANATINERCNQLHVRVTILDTIQDITPGFYISDKAQPMFDKVTTRAAKPSLFIADLFHFRVPLKTLKIITGLQKTEETTIGAQRISPELEKSWRRLFDTVVPALPDEVYAQILIGNLPFKQLQLAPIDLMHDAFLIWRARLAKSPVLEIYVIGMPQRKAELRPELFALYYIHRDPWAVKEERKRQAQSMKHNVLRLFSLEEVEDQEGKERSYQDALKYAENGRNKKEDANRVKMFVARMFSRAVERMAKNRLLCSTKRGRIGWVPREAMVGDVVCVLDGAKVPFVLKPDPERKDVFRVVGEAYVHGLMQGEGWTAGGGHEIVLV